MESKITYPLDCAPRGDTVDEYKVNDKYPCQVADPYRFMEDPDAEATKKWVAAQNEITDAFLAQCDQRSKLKEKITECWNYPKRGIPKKRGDHYYFAYNTGLQNQMIWYRITQPNTYKTDEADALAGTTVFLDPNLLAADGTASLGSQVWSDDGKYNAYQVKRSGSDWATIHVREADSGKDLETDVLQWVKFSGMSWTADNKGFFYSKFDAPKDQDQASMDNKAGKETEKLEYQKVFYHRVGTKQSDDVLIYQDKTQPVWMFDASVTHDGKYLLLDIRKDCDDLGLLYYADLTKNAALDKEIEFTPLITEWLGGFTYVHNLGSKGYFKTNYRASRSRVICIDFENPAEANWVEVLPEDPVNVLQDAECMNGQIIATYLQAATERLKAYDFSHPAKHLADIKLPDIGSIATIDGKHDSAEMMFKFTSFTDPGSAWRVDLNDFSTENIGVTKLADESIKMEDFVTDQVFYPSKDGTKVPMFMVRKKSTLATTADVPEKPILTTLYGYGGFNISITPMFSPSRLVYLNNLGGMLCVANIRGGGEYGEEWHAAGTKERKQNVFDDFIAAAEWLQEKKYTDKDHIVIQGGSNGGTLVSACANQRPDLFAGVICQVPVTDMLRFHKFTIGHFWCSDFGCSEKDGGFDYLIKYSPLHNVKAQKYPAMLTCTADHDDRVVPLHSFKYVAELQHTAGEVEGQRPLLVRIEVNAGHGAGKPTEKIIAEVADVYGFVAKITGAQWQD